MPDQPAVKFYRRVAIFQKGHLYGAVGVTIADGLYAVGSMDPRCSPAVHLRSYETAAEAVHQFREHVRITRDNGWTVVFNNRPNYG